MRHFATLACEKVIIDKKNAHSLIDVMTNAEIQTVMGQNVDVEQAKMPSNAVIPKDWYIFSIWQQSREEIGKTFEQVVQVYWPNDDKFTEGRLLFKPVDDKAQYNSVRMLGFPAGQDGKIKVLTWIEHEKDRITDVFDYYVTIRNVAPQTVSASGML
jgi:hypothetical protein